jgi:HEAT repeat protein
LHSDVVEAILEVLFKTDRAVAVAALLSAPSWEVLGAVKRLLRGALADGAAQQDIPLAEAALRTADDAVRCLAFDVLAEREVEIERQLVVSLLDSEDPNLRIRGRFVLARAGDKRCVENLLAMATNERNVLLRAQAVRWLGRLASASEHLELFERLVRTDRESLDGELSFSYRLPVTEEAALALGGIGGERGLSALVRAALSRPHRITLDILLAGVRVGARERELGRLTSWERRSLVAKEREACVRSVLDSASM